MSSVKQIEANRANAQRSTGPRTELGKAQSRKNAWKHGLSAKKIVIGDEDAAEFEELRADLLRDFAPCSRMAAELVEYIAGLMWQLRRVPGLEAAVIKAHCAEITHKQFLREDAILLSRRKQHPDQHIGLALIRDAEEDDVLGKIDRHHTALLSSLAKALQMLWLIQSREAHDGGAVPQ
jgi:hypothetical protein